MADEQPIYLEHNAKVIGELCPVCYKGFAAGDSVIACPRCKQVHHSDCWHSQGCARLGCPQVATRVHDDRPRVTDDDRAKAYIKPVPKWVPWTATFLALFLLIGVPMLQKYVFADPRPKITMLIPAGTDEAILEAVGHQFETSHPELQVEVLLAPSGGMYQQKLMIMIGARDAPDLFILPWANFVTLASQGIYADLTEWVGTSPDSLANLPPHRLEQGRVEGVWYGVPHPNRAAFFGIYAGSELLSESIQLLDEIISHLPVDESIEDSPVPVRIVPQFQAVPGI